MMKNAVQRLSASIRTKNRRLLFKTNLQLHSSGYASFSSSSSSSSPSFPVVTNEIFTKANAWMMEEEDFGGDNNNNNKNNNKNNKENKFGPVDESRARSEFDMLMNQNRVAESIDIFKQLLSEKLSSTTPTTPAAGTTTGDMLLQYLHRILHGLRLKGEPGSFQTGLELVNALDKASSGSSSNGQNKSMKPQLKTFSMLLHLLELNPAAHGVCDQMKAIKDRVLLSGEYATDLKFWNSCLVVLSRASPFHPEAWINAEKLFGEIQNHGIEPNEITYSLVLHTLAVAEGGSNARRAQQLLESLLASPSSRHLVTEDWFNICIDGWARCRNADGARRAERLLEAMLAEGLSGNGPLPSNFSYTCAINAWANSGHPEAPDRAEHLLQQQIQLQVELQAPPDYVTYTAVINAWSRSSKRGAAERAMALLEAMEEAFANGNDNACPSVLTYASVIDAWARSTDRNAAIRAEDLLDRMKNLSSSGRHDLAPNTIVYSAVINTWSKSKAKDAPDRAMRLLREVQVQKLCNTVCYNAVISAFAQKGDSGTALLLLDEMKNSNQSDIVPNTITYSAVLHALAKSRQSHKAAQQARQILYEMQTKSRQRRNQHDYDDLKPNVIAYTSAISAMAKAQSTDAAVEAENILWEMQAMYEEGDEDVRPNALTLAAVMNCWCLSSSEEAPERVSYLIEWGSKKNLFTSEVGYCICLNYLLGAWRRSRRPNAVDTLKQMIQERERNPDLPDPDVHSYNHLIAAMEPPHVNDAAHMRFRCLRLLVDGYVAGETKIAPNLRTVHLVLAACRMFRDGKDVTPVVKQMKSLIKFADGWSPNAATFRLFFDACDNLVGVDRSELEEMYEHCRMIGCHDKGVRDAFMRSCGASSRSMDH